MGGHGGGGWVDLFCSGSAGMCVFVSVCVYVLEGSRVGLFSRYDLPFS